MSVLYVLDVDGTVADLSHRKHHLEKAEADWDAFFEPSALLADTPIEAALDHFEDGRFRHGECVYLTARIESVHDETKHWLVQHGFAREDTRVLCKPDVLRLQRSAVFKPSVLRTIARYDYPGRELVMVDDYGAVRRAVEEAGFRTRHAPDCWSEAW